MQQAAADQASKSFVTGATPPAAVAATDPSDPLAAPVWTIEREEPLTLRAGTLKTLKIVARNKKTGALIYEMWYAPAARSYARLREVVRGGVRERELIAYKIIQSASASPRHPGNDAKHLLELKM
jgi:hypothetical protein